MPLPDPEAPDQSLGDCAICMDAILVDPSLRRRSKSSDSKERPALGRAGGILEKVGGAKKTYSLAPCHHLFVSAYFGTISQKTFGSRYQHSIPSAWKEYVAPFAPLKLTVLTLFSSSAIVACD